MKDILKNISNPVFDIIKNEANASKTEVYLVGGYVRDLIMKRDNTDIDIVCIGNGIDLAKNTAGAIDKKIKVSIYKRFGTAHFNWKGIDYEFVGARKESYSKDSRKPNVIAGTIEDDQNRRDFTINAMGISLNEKNYGNLIDPFDGIKDIKEKILQTPLDPDITFSDDPLRMIRAIRFASQLSFTISENTFNGIKKNVERINIVSQERITDELQKIMASPKPSVGLKLLFDSGLLKIIFPELHALQGVKVINNFKHKDNFYHTLQVIDNVAEVSDNIWLRWAALLHDIGKDATKRLTPNGWTFHSHEAVGSRMTVNIFKKLKLPLNHSMKYVKKLVYLHLRPIGLAKEMVTDSGIRRLLFEAGDDLEDLLTLCRADITSKNETKVVKYLANFDRVEKRCIEVEKNDKLKNWQPPVSGEMIMDTFQINPSREVGIIKTAIREAILDGIIKNNFQEAYDFMLKEGEKLGLYVKEKS